MSTAREAEDDVEQEGLLSGAHKRTPRPTLTLGNVLKKTLPATLLIGIFVLVSASIYHDVSREVKFLDDGEHDWAQYSPYTPQDKYVPPPAGCRITQVNILQRHGARYPTAGATKNIVAALSKLLSVGRYEDARFKFLEQFTYELGSDDLVPFGADQSLHAGEETFRRYSYLVDMDNLPFVRASSAERVVLSALNWTKGFSAASDYMFQPKLSVILSEAANNTLDDRMCPSSGSSTSQTSIWLAQYAPSITSRLNAAAPGANLTDVDTFSLISLCPFETVAKRTKSAFCDVFEAEPGAFAGFAYSGDLDKFYGTGYGEPLGPVQGVGYVNELLARLTSTPVRDHTQTNRTLDSSHETFPLNHTIYVDFSHDNQMVAIYSAIGLFRQPDMEPLDPVLPDVARVWRIKAMTPFSGRMAVERMECDVTDEGKEMAVRVLVNDKVQSLEFCGADSNGLCILKDFIRSQTYARHDGNGDWERCHA